MADNAFCFNCGNKAIFIRWTKENNIDTPNWFCNKCKHIFGITFNIKIQND